MIVRHPTIESFVNELVDADVENSVVRFSVDTERVNDGVAQVGVRCGFLDGEDVHVMEGLAGENIAGDDVQAGTNAAETIRAKLAGVCEKNGLALKGGFFDVG